MMQRKKPTTAKIQKRTSAPLIDDNDKNKAFTNSNAILKYICLPEVPVPLKFVLITFLSFAVLTVLTAKDHHAAFHYGMRGRHNLPEPLRVTLTKRIDSNIHEQLIDAHNVDTSNKAAISFVEAEQRLKKQLLTLMQLQKEEKTKYNGKRIPNENESVLGVQIANRYLGEDMLPYPMNKGDEKEWMKRMERRKNDLRESDAKEWNDLMQIYEEDMGHNIHNDDIPTKAGRNNNHWPLPTEKLGSNSKILLQPAFGSHRSSSNAIFVFAEGYDLSIYLAFFESLLVSGFKGDVVISISTQDKLKPGVKEYLTSSKGPLNIVGYEVEWTCYNQSGRLATGANEGVNHCQMNNVFGDVNFNYVTDPRDPRPVATARYELYWIWSLRYEVSSWIMLIDARDSWFQLDPFRGLEDRDIGSDGGELHLFGENADVVRIGTSNYNRKWLITAYGRDSVEPYFDKPVICSGSTMGHQIAIETYLRAMIAQFDLTNCKSKGCDQGFHNYLYYSGQLGDESAKSIAEGISKVIIHDQGDGIINNLGALREQPLSERGLYNAETGLVLNWDGSTSAVAHQYDRDNEVNAMVKMKKRQFQQQWKEYSNTKTALS